jgi:hypothetical protein
MTNELSDQARAMLERALVEERPLVPGAGRRARLKRSLLQSAIAAGAGKAAAAPLAAGAATQGIGTGVVALLPLAKGVGIGLLLTAGAALSARILSAPPAVPVSTPSALPAPRVLRASTAETARSEAAPAPLSVDVDVAPAPGAPAPATRAAERFLQRDDSSVLAERVRRSCAFDDGGQRR